MNSAQRANEYDRRYPESTSDFGQKVERMERIELKARRRDGGGRSRYHSVPDLPWKRETPE